MRCLAGDGAAAGRGGAGQAHRGDRATHLRSPGHDVSGRHQVRQSGSEPGFSELSVQKPCASRLFLIVLGSHGAAVSERLQVLLPYGSTRHHEVWLRCLVYLEVSIRLIRTVRCDAAACRAVDAPCAVKAALCTRSPAVEDQRTQARLAGRSCLRGCWLLRRTLHLGCRPSVPVQLGFHSKDHKSTTQTRFS